MPAVEPRVGQLEPGRLRGRLVQSYICHQCTHRLAYLNLAHNFSDYSANYSTDYFTYYCDAYDFANYSTDYFTYYCGAWA
ncbi:hypothetical protein CYMTET_23472 [Cymbomonas tetramitiformis]|uniref:Uncharacterized protein n=1 Tax=Cymbomonas tetramitiformis TaxID=36881 RepID=A0AAE0FXV9_9CHLO|nr:hypothetical protein CYMTET_23472 [Cymbomonas tetramitiformis]